MSTTALSTPTNWVARRAPRVKIVTSGHEGLDDEGAAVGQARGDVREAAQLILLSQEGEQGVEHHIDERIPAGNADVREISHRDGDPIAALLRPELRDHGLGRVDPMHLDTSGRQRQGHATRPDPKLQSGSFAGQPSQEFNSRLRVFGQREPRVVDVRDPLAVRRWPVIRVH